MCIPVTTCRPTACGTQFFVTSTFKTYLLSTIYQERLNHVAILHVHKELTDQLDLHAICIDFVGQNAIRGKKFAMFKDIEMFFFCVLITVIYILKALRSRIPVLQCPAWLHAYIKIQKIARRYDLSL